MRNTLLFICACAIAFTSCVKDKDTSNPNVHIGDRILIHYWNFNYEPLDTAIMRRADTSIGGGIFDYVADRIDTLDGGSDINLRYNEPAGWSVRLRNPYTSMTIHMPTTGYKQPIFTFCVMCSGSSGPTGNDVSYTTDGTNFVTTGLSQTHYDIPLTWISYSIDFSAITAVNDNPNFAIRLSTSNNNTGTKGNNRYDNITLDAYRK
jgi:hypothetical protein